MTSRTIAIGDIHGCANALRSLIEAIQPSAEDTIISLGDLVDRGPDSKGVVDQLLELRERTNLVVIMGNHEEMMLAVMDGESPLEWLKHGGGETMESYGFTGDISVVPESHIELMRNALLYHEMDTHFFTHGNYEHDKPLDQQDPMICRWRSLVQKTPRPHISGKKAVVGHTPDKSGEIFDIGHLVCLDTYCYGGAWLTAVDVANGTIWQANDEGEMRP